MSSNNLSNNRRNYQTLMSEALINIENSSHSRSHVKIDIGSNQVFDLDNENEGAQARKLKIKKNKQNQQKSAHDAQMQLKIGQIPKQIANNAEKPLNANKENIAKQKNIQKTSNQVRSIAQKNDSINKPKPQQSIKSDSNTIPNSNGADQLQTLLSSRPIEIIFQHFCQQTNIKDIKSTPFDNKNKQGSLMNINKWKIFCKEYEFAAIILERDAKIKSEAEKDAKNKNEANIPQVSSQLKSKEKDNLKNQKQTQNPKNNKQTQQKINVKSTDKGLTKVKVHSKGHQLRADRIDRQLSDIFKKCNDNFSQMDINAFRKAIFSIYQTWFSDKEGGLQQFINDVLQAGTERSCRNKLKNLRVKDSQTTVNYVDHNVKKNRSELVLHGGRLPDELATELEIIKSIKKSHKEQKHPSSNLSKFQQYVQRKSLSKGKTDGYKVNPIVREAKMMLGKQNKASYLKLSVGDNQKLKITRHLQPAALQSKKSKENLSPLPHFRYSQLEIQKSNKNLFDDLKKIERDHDDILSLHFQNERKAGAKYQGLIGQI